MDIKINKLNIALALAMSLPCALASASNPITESINDKYVEAGDVLQIAVPLTGLAATWFHDDKEGAKQFIKSFASTIAVVQATKYTVGRVRPNTSNELSFPSGHTAAAFSGAAFLQSRYGAKWGVPAYIAASYVGASRIYGNKHYADDVLAGASIAFLMDKFFVSPYSDGLKVTAAPSRDGFMVGVNIENSFFSDSSENSSKARDIHRHNGDNKHRFQLDVGFSKYDVIASATLDKDSMPVDDIQIATAVNYRYKLESDRYFQLEVAPNEARSVSTDDGGLLTSLRDWSIAGSYQMNVLDNTIGSVELGAGLAGHYISAGQVDTADVYHEIRDYKVLPMVNATATLKLMERLNWVNKAQFRILGRDRAEQFETGLSYLINSEWEVGAKYLRNKSKWGEQGLEYKSEQGVLTIANYF
ncbi:phosphatase PAP2 family protein [Vibrio amylolyticus]|uniref:phosphatase PAP2 family protein n=1 Tax=Vibrio amylolyticus TaxID=2847292 RepID=UPI00354B2291